MRRLATSEYCADPLDSCVIDERRSFQLVDDLHNGVCAVFAADPQSVEHVEEFWGNTLHNTAPVVVRTNTVAEAGRESIPASGAGA